MPYVAKRFGEKRLKMQFLIDDDEINLEYHPFVFTPEMEEEVSRWRQSKDAGQFRDKIYDLFLRLVIEWDVVYQEGDVEPIELTMESLRAKPDLLFLELALIARIKEEVNMGEALRTSSNLNGHSPVPSGAKRRR